MWSSRSKGLVLPDVNRLLAVASTPRTGSNLLCRGLGATGLVPTPDEWLVEKQLARWEGSRPLGRPLLHRRMVRRAGRTLGVERLASVSRYARAPLERYLVERSRAEQSMDGTASIKVMWSMYFDFLVQADLGFHSLSQPVVWVRTRRADRLRQAVSLARALTSQQWGSTSTPVRAVEFDAALIERCLGSIEYGERGWDSYFASHRIDPFEVVYEDLDRDYEAVMAAVFRHCDIDAAVPARQLERQADATTEEWIARYRSERGAGRR